MILYDFVCSLHKSKMCLVFGFTSFITWLLCCGAHAGPTSARTEWVSDSNYLNGQWCTTVLVYNSYASHRILCIDWTCCDETIYVIVYSMSFNHFDYFATFSFQTTSQHSASKHRQIYLQEAFVSCLHTFVCSHESNYIGIVPPSASRLVDFSSTAGWTAVVYPTNATACPRPMMRRSSAQHGKLQKSWPLLWHQGISVAWVCMSNLTHVPRLFSCAAGLRAGGTDAIGLVLSVHSRAFFAVYFTIKG